MMKVLALLPLAGAKTLETPAQVAPAGAENPVITVTSPDQIPKGAPADVKEHLESAPTTAANENPTAAATEKAAEEHPLPQMPTNATTTDTAQTREANVDQHKPDTAMAVNADGSVSMTDSSRTATPQAPADAKDSVRAQTDATTPPATATEAEVAPHDQSTNNQQATATTEPGSAPAPAPESPPTSNEPAALKQGPAPTPAPVLLQTDAANATDAPTTAPATEAYGVTTTTQGCFEGSTALDTIKGSIRMDEAQVGDWVRTAIGFEPILGWFHANEDAKGMEFLKISTESGEVLTLTPSHVLYLANGLLVAAESLDFGDSILTSDGEVTMVTGIEKTTSDNGFYNPITASTSVVVNGIVASTFTMDLGLFTSAAMLSIWTTIISGVARVAQLFGLEKKMQPPVAPQVAVVSS